MICQNGCTVILGRVEPPLSGIVYNDGRPRREWHEEDAAPVFASRFRAAQEQTLDWLANPGIHFPEFMRPLGIPDAVTEDTLILLELKRSANNGHNPSASAFNGGLYLVLDVRCRERQTMPAQDCQSL